MARSNAPSPRGFPRFNTVLAAKARRRYDGGRRRGNTPHGKSGGSSRNNMTALELAKNCSKHGANPMRASPGGQKGVRKAAR